MGNAQITSYKERQEIVAMMTRTPRGPGRAKMTIALADRLPKHEMFVQRLRARLCSVQKLPNAARALIRLPSFSSAANPAGR